MEYGVTGITTTSKNVCIPISNASIGDVLCYKKGATGFGIENFIAVAGSTVQVTPPDGYRWYGVIYGFEKGGIMVRALSTSMCKWSSVSGSSNTFIVGTHDSVIDTMTTNSGTMRNGNSNTTIGMNAYAMGIACASSTSTALHPTTAANLGSGIPMREYAFDNDSNGAKTLYGTYENYLKQTFSLMKGSQGGIFGIRCGKKNTKNLQTNGSNGESFTAAKYCYGYNAVIEESGLMNWWLPDMYELATLLNDDSYKACEYATSVLGGTISLVASDKVLLWSSICRNYYQAWGYHYNGYAGFINVTNSALAVPVTLISLS